MHAAMVAAVSDKGYEMTRVADVIERAGVSRNAFYGQFDNKQECYLSTLDALAGMAGNAVRAAYGAAEGSWDDRLLAAFAAVGDLIVAQPAAARLGLVEIYAAGASAIERIDAIEWQVEAEVSRVLLESPSQAGMPQEVVLAVLGGLRKVIYTRVREGRVDELPELAATLLEWATSYETPTVPLSHPPKAPERLAAALPDPADSRERILRAVTELVAEKGYQSLVITEIAERASVSLSTFYLLFEGKEAAFAAALLETHRLVFEATLPIVRGAPDWEHAISAGTRGFFGFLATHPASAQVGGVGVWETTAASLDMRAQGMAALSMVLDEGYRKYPDAPAGAREAVGGTIDALMFNWLRHKGAERLYEIAPTAAFIALAPFVGSERAVELANAESFGVLAAV